MVGTSFGLSSFVVRRPLSEGLVRTLTEGWTQRESLSSVDTPTVGYRRTEGSGVARLKR